MTPPSLEDHDAPSARTRRVRALARKESLQVLRDPSSLSIGVFLPVLLIIIFGYGLSFDPRDVRIAVVLEEPSQDASDLAAGFQLSSSFDARLVTSMARAQELMSARKVDGIFRIPQDFARRLAIGNAEVQVLVHGTDANRARLIDGYARGAIAQFGRRRAAERKSGLSSGRVEIVSRQWFNDANDSRMYLVPGLIVIIMTLVGALLTALVVAREYERGTLEAMFVTPVRPAELLLGKTIPYFLLGLIGLLLCLLSARFLFGVPFRGSVLVLAGSSILYLLVSLGAGLLVSSVLRSQFLASQIILIGTFLPAAMLSGAMFDIHDMPPALRALTRALPARYFVSLLQTIFLAGDLPRVIWPNAAVLAAVAALLLGAVRAVTRKKL